jgi:sterol desaturase/sphingolipid hydroxylase (fatty acid hydroxylase superfamily)
VLTVWSFYRESASTYLLILVGAQLFLGLLEPWFPARPDWTQHAREKLTNISVVVIVGIGTLVVAGMYVSLLAEPLATLRVAMHMDIWPTDWPIIVQVFMVFFISEFIWYWAHRAEHRWTLVWRLSGHGAHHSFKRLGAINFGANHPLEMFLLVLPSALVELFFGAGLAAAGAAVLTVVQASMAHTNIKMNTRWIGLLFTTNAYHFRHHSTVLEESNTNYGCSTIIWDRLFGTFEEGPVVEAGTGPTEPTLWQKFMMPIKEPEDTAIAPR